jgi:hypothetical protein
VLTKTPPPGRCGGVGEDNVTNGIVRRKRGCCNRKSGGFWGRFHGRETSHFAGFIGPDLDAAKLPSGFHSAMQLPEAGRSRL